MNQILLILPLLIMLSGCCESSSQQPVEPNPSPVATVTRSDAESRYVNHCLKSEVVTVATLREFNAMTVDRIDEFANGCEMAEKHKHE